MQKLPFYDEDYVYQASEIQPILQNDTCRKYRLLQGLLVRSVKTTTYLYNRFKMDFFFQIQRKRFETNQL